MRIQRVSVKGLFGIFDHEIPMNKPESVTIIHGPNGFGKTVMLKMIAGALRGDINVFTSLPFQEFRLDFDDKTSWLVRKKQIPEGAKPPLGAALEVVTIDAQGDLAFTDLASREPEPNVLRILDRIDSRVPGPYSRQGNGWTDNRGNFFSVNQILELFPVAKSAVPSGALASVLGGTWKPLGIDVFVVEANRLASTDTAERSDAARYPHLYEEPDFTPGPRPTRIEQYSQDLVQRIKNVRSDYAKVTQERDSTFPERLVQFMRTKGEALDESDVVAKLEQLDRKRQKLISLGFLDSEKVLGVFKDEDARLAREALTIYVDDVSKKLSAFDDMAERAGKLIAIAKDRFDYKTLSIGRDKGFVVESESGNRVRLDDLSSGEQHELILLYELLFRTPANGLILVDEPEISLHVGWQSRFLSDLIDILRLNGAYALVATHSPVLIGNQWNLTQELRGPKQKVEAGQR